LYIRVDKNKTCFSTSGFLALKKIKKSDTNV
jgi:hypothetical protein